MKACSLGLPPMDNELNGCFTDLRPTGNGNGTTMASTNLRPTGNGMTTASTNLRPTDNETNSRLTDLPPTGNGMTTASTNLPPTDNEMNGRFTDLPPTGKQKTTGSVHSPSQVEGWLPIGNFLQNRKINHSISTIPSEYSQLAPSQGSKSTCSHGFELDTGDFMQLGNRKRKETEMSSQLMTDMEYHAANSGFSCDPDWETDGASSYSTKDSASTYNTSASDTGSNCFDDTHQTDANVTVPGSMTPNFDMLKSQLETLAADSGFKLNRSLTYLSEKQFRRYFQNHSYVQTVAKGRFQCKGSSRKQGKCPFFVRFQVLHNEGGKCKVVSSNVKHNHPRQTTLKLNGKKICQYKHEVPEEVLDTISKLGAHFPTTNLRNHISCVHPKVLLHNDLLYRLKKEAVIKEFGSDDHISKLMELGLKYQAGGGKFEVDIGPDARVKSFWLMKDGMQNYTQVYGDFSIADGTFNTNRHNYILVPHVVVDALGWTTMVGFTVALTENSESIKKGMTLFGLDTPASVWMTDGGSAFPSVAEELSLTHVTCSYHFVTTAMSAKVSMPHDTGLSFESAVRKLIYDDMTQEVFLHMYESVMEEFSMYPRVVWTLKNIWQERERVCYTYTGQHFTCCHTSSQRGEIANAVIKRRTTNPSVYKRMSFAELANTLHSVTDETQARALIELKQLLKVQKGWSTFVDKIWSAEHHLSPSYECKPHQTDWKVYHREKPNRVRVVTVGNDENIPVCTCATYQSSRIPCRHICAVYCRISHDLWNVKNLHPRWRLTNHPLYPIAMKSLGLMDEEVLDHQQPLSEHMNLKANVYHAINFPLQHNRRYNALLADFKELAALGMHNPHVFKTAKMGLISLVNKLRDITNEDESNNIVAPPPLLEPATIELHNDNINLSQLSGARNGRKKRRVQTCSLCHQSGHRKGPNCPLFVLDNTS